jgi:hypothetical protein
MGKVVRGQRRLGSLHPTLQQFKNHTSTRFSQRLLRSKQDHREIDKGDLAHSREVSSETIRSQPTRICASSHTLLFDLGRGSVTNFGLDRCLKCTSLIFKPLMDRIVLSFFAYKFPDPPANTRPNVLAHAQTLMVCLVPDGITPRVALPGNLRCQPLHFPC